MTHPLTDEMCRQIFDGKKSSKSMTEYSHCFVKTDAICDCMRTAFDKGAEHRLGQVIEWLEANPIEDYVYADYTGAIIRENEFLENFKKTMRPQEES